MRRRTARIQGTRASEAKQDRTCDFAIDSLDSASPYWWCLILSYCRHLNLREIENFPIGIDEQSRSAETRLAGLSARLMTSFKQNSQRKETRY